MRLAVVGAGVSGLVAAWRLQAEHEVTVFEAEGRVGGHSHTVDVDLDGERHAVDTGFIVYNEATYPGFTRLLRELDVQTQPSDMSFSVRCDRSGIEWASPNLNTVFAWRRNALRPGFRRMLRDVLRFQSEALALLNLEAEKASLGEWLCGGGYSQEFVDLYALPMGAAIWSADPSSFLDFPAVQFARFFSNHGLLERPSPVQWRTVRGGSQRYVEALTAGFRDRIRTRTRVCSVRRHAVGVEVATANGEHHAFDRVVLATHSDQALALLAEPSDLERRLLGAIRYQPNDVILHTDPSVMPRRRRAWASWNYRATTRRSGCVDVTYHMNRLQGIRSFRPLLVSLNAAEHIDPARVLGRWRYDHPVFDRDAMQAQRLHARIDGLNRTHYCGAWQGHGFHEDGVRSGLAVAERLGSPWR
jgi:predicted NAD/FAD-binding protein